MPRKASQRFYAAHSQHLRYMRRCAINRRARQQRVQKQAEAEGIGSHLIFLAVIAAMTIIYCLVFKGFD